MNKFITASCKADLKALLLLACNLLILTKVVTKVFKYIAFY